MHNDASVLLADDSEEDALLIRHAFQKAGIPNPLHIVNSCEEAISYLSGRRGYSNREEHPLPHLLLLDLRMQGLDGFELLRWVRHRPGLESLAIVVMTASHKAWDMNEAYRLGANSFLLKPTDFEGLIELARGLDRYWLNQGNTPGSSRNPAPSPQGHSVRPSNSLS
jgi:CheY-like chemotaxis protein